jgi:hypothetical protein
LNLFLDSQNPLETLIFDPKTPSHRPKTFCSYAYFGLSAHDKSTTDPFHSAALRKDDKSWGSNFRSG